MKLPQISQERRQWLSQHFAPLHSTGISIDASRTKTAEEFVLAKATKTPPNHGVSSKPVYKLFLKA